MKKKAFTLIELLVVIAIIGLLASMAVIALNNARMKARDSRRVSDVRQMQTALEMYYLDQNTYPNAGLAWSSVAGWCISSGGQGWTATCTGTTYMGTSPAAPTPVEIGCTSTDNSYSYSGTSTNYSLKYCLGSAVGNIAAGVHTASNTGITH
jgi:general secretion pathway protein G